MSTSAGPNIVEDGLVLSLDAANFKSFRGEPTTNLISSSGIDVSVYSPYNPMKFERVVEPEADSGFALEMTVEDINVNNSSRSRFGEATNIPTSGFAFVSIYARFVEGEPANIRPRAYTGLVWGVLNPLDGGSIYLTSEYRRFGAYLEFGTNSGGPNPGFSMTLENSNKQVGQKTRWHSPQVELKEYATPFVNGTRGSTVETGGGLIDLSGNENHGTLYERTLGLKAYSNYIDFPDPTGSVGRQYGYLRSNIPTGPISYTAIISFYPYSVSGERHLFRTSNNFGANIVSGRIQYYTTSYNVETAYTPNNSVLENNWCFFSLVYDRDSSKHIAYINGKFASEKQHSVQYSIINGYQNWGARNDTYAAGLNGRIGNVLMYNRPLSAKENMEIFNAYRGRYGI